ncbi:MAG: phosphotransferase family protein [Acidimicrobiales bacterium]|nr:phosphotransferase family protein [Acidimicrobiales bacterium]
MASPAGIDVSKLTRWFDDQVGGIDSDSLVFELITGGRSNLTYTVSDGVALGNGGRRWVLRRPPLGHVLATAHDMVREHRIISALADSGVPVPGMIGLCEDNDVNGAPFYVMEFVPGLVVRDVDTAQEVPVAVRHRMSQSLVEVLARLHDIDVGAVGLTDLSRQGGYIERQLKRWSTQFEKSTTRVVPGVLETFEILASRIPTQQGVGIVHGDYRLDNCMMTPEGQVAAVLDWELCTLGDVLADVAGMIAYTDDLTTGGTPPPTSVAGFHTSDEIKDAYGRHSNRDLTELDYYVAFAYWRIACIVEGVYTRYAAGVMGNQEDPWLVEVLGQRVFELAQVAHQSASRLPKVH